MIKDVLFTDPRDGETYRTVKIGNQIWMAENLRFKCETLLYCWERVPGVIPEGWHLPTADEWRIMFLRIGAKFSGTVDGEDAYAGAAKLLKSAAPQHSGPMTSSINALTAYNSTISRMMPTSVVPRMTSPAPATSAA